MQVRRCGVAVRLPQCCPFSRNIAYVTPEIVYFYHQKKHLLDQSIQKNNDVILKKLYWISVGSGMFDHGKKKGVSTGALNEPSVVQSRF